MRVHRGERIDREKKESNLEVWRKTMCTTKQKRVSLMKSGVSKVFSINVEFEPRWWALGVDMKSSATQNERGEPRLRWELCMIPHQVGTSFSLSPVYRCSSSLSMPVERFWPLATPVLFCQKSTLRPLLVVFLRNTDVTQARFVRFGSLRVRRVNHSESKDRWHIAPCKIYL